MKQKSLIALGVGAILLVGATAGATAYIADDNKEAAAEQIKTSSKTNVTYNQPATQQAPIPSCDDDNIVGKVVGGAAGGIAGSQFGKGNGKTAATIGGAVGGTLLGEEYIPTRNVTCR